MSKTYSADFDLSPSGVERTSDLPSSWREAPQGWGHSLHKMSPYVGGFPPALAHYFIRKYTGTYDTVLDPFCGGGTTPLETALLNRHGWGNDVFSYAYVLSHAKCRPLRDEEFQKYLDKKLSEAGALQEDDITLEDKGLKAFYSEYTLNKLLRLREVLRDEQSTEALYLKAIICGILHGPSDMYLSLQTKDTYSSTPNYVREYAEKNDLERPEADIRPRAIRKHRLAQEDYVPPWINSGTRITQTDSRSLKFPDDGVDLILTSPPYMRVLDYTWNNWIRLWWLGDDREEERESLDLTSDVSKYRKFIRESLREMYRVLADDGVAVLIVGDVEKSLASGKQTLNTAGYIAQEASKHTDFEVQGMFEDAYNVDNRRYVVFNQLRYDHEESESAVPIDRCLILSKGCPESREPLIDWEGVDSIYEDPS